MDSEMLKAIIMGVVQGLTEFLPVSSTAHLILFPWFFGWTGEIDSLIFDVALHGGTLVALLICFYRDWIDLLTKNRTMFYYIIIATIPAGVAGILLNDLVEHTFRSPFIIIVSLVIFGILMLIAESYSKRLAIRIEGQASLKDYIFIGLAQAIALIPGVSRSGITITAGLFRNLTRESAARFSFLLSTPVIGGAVLLEGRKLFIGPVSYNLDLFAIGFISALVSGYFAIRFLLYFLRRHPMNIFVYYRFVLAAIILIAVYK